MGAILQYGLSVALVGIGTVFVGLIILIALIKLMEIVMASATGKKKAAAPAPAAPAPVAEEPVEETDDLLLVTSGGQMIRTRIDQVRIVGRSSQGVTIFRTGKDEKVVSVERLPESGGDDAEVAGEEGEG